MVFFLPFLPLVVGALGAIGGAAVGVSRAGASVGGGAAAAGASAGAGAAAAGESIKAGLHDAAGTFASTVTAATQQYVHQMTEIRKEAMRESSAWRNLMGHESELWRRLFTSSVGDLRQALEYLLQLQLLMFLLECALALFITYCAIEVVIRRNDPTLRNPITQMVKTVLCGGALLLAGTAIPRAWVYLYFSVSVSQVILVALGVGVGLAAVARRYRAYLPASRLPIYLLRAILPLVVLACALPSAPYGALQYVHSAANSARGWIDAAAAPAAVRAMLHSAAGTVVPNMFYAGEPFTALGALVLSVLFAVTLPVGAEEKRHAVPSANGQYCFIAPPATSKLIAAH